ncbi:hypothetical protein [uncultured Maricaulis sp.]|jgi:hypothetical protein|uniref:hypothetical protein n=1 Tax=uncultured Maricaulis sp. TaxID=174710 RepID=UPI0030D8B27A|tara:strand:+ start:1828 stop:2151 length:324 start_codon:yes stop_codon:yes gene_type:complete
MYDSFYDRLSNGFTGYDWWLIIVLSLVAALIMRKWPQWPAAAAIMFMVDAVAPFFYRWAIGVPPNFAFDFAFSRLDERGGVVVLLRLAIYFVLIGAIFFSKRRIGER